MSNQIYYDESASLDALDGLAVTVVGYGVQGRAFAANLRDSGINVRVGNIDDEYYQRAVQDAHTVSDIPGAVRGADIVLLLIPDEAHGPIFEKQIVPHLGQNTMLVVAHGHSLLQGHVRASPSTDLAMLAPRMYGDPIRQYYLSGKGAPAYVDVIQDSTGKTLERTLAIAKAVGFTRAGVMRLSYEEETMLDLFQEQFLTPALVDLVETGFRVLVEQGFNPKAALLEVYGSGEMGKMMLDGAEIGLDEVIRLQGSPTCQVGYHLYRDKLLPPQIADHARAIIGRLRSGDFSARLKCEAESGYPLLEQSRKAVQERLISKVHRDVREAFNFPSEEKEGMYLAHGGALGEARKSKPASKDVKGVLDEEH